MTEDVSYIPLQDSDRLFLIHADALHNEVNTVESMKALNQIAQSRTLLQETKHLQGFVFVCLFFSRLQYFSINE